jgi:sugar phosphate permease
MVPALIGIAGMLANGWHSDKTKERRLHTAIPLLIAGVMYGLLISVRHNSSLAISFLLLGSGSFYACLPVFWGMPTMILSESAAAAAIGLINSIAQLGGFAGPYVIGFLNDRTHSLTASFGFIALALVAGASLILNLRIRDPLQDWRSDSKVNSRSHDAVIRVYDDASNVIETYEHAGQFREW